MTFPAITNTATSGSASSSTTHTVNLPATINANDFIVILAATDGAPTTVPPTGFTEIFDTNELHVFVKVATGSEGSTVTFSTSAAESSAHITLVGDTWFEDLAGIEISTSAGATSASPNPDSVTASWGSDDNLFVANFAASRGDRTTTGYPTNYAGSNIDNPNGGGASGAQIACATRDLAASNDDPGAFSMSGTAPNRASTIVIRPAAAAGGGRIMSSLAAGGGLVGVGGIAGRSGGLAG